VQQESFKKWSAEHAVFYHAQQPKICIDNNKLFTPAVCYTHSVCVCGKHPKSRPDALHVFNRLVDKLKQIFTETKTHVSEQRLLLETGAIVFRIRSSSVEDVLEGVQPGSAFVAEYFVHVGYVNFKTWSFTILRLTKVTNRNQNGYLQLTPVACDGHIPFHGIRTFVQFAAENLDFKLAFTLKIYKLVSNDEMLSEEFMVGKCVEVEEFKNIQEFTFWMGSSHERRQRSLKASKSKGSAKPQKRRQSENETGALDKPPKRRKQHSAKNMSMTTPFSALSILANVDDDATAAVSSRQNADNLEKLLVSDWPDSEGSIESRVEFPNTDISHEDGEEEASFEDDQIDDSRASDDDDDGNDNLDFDSDGGSGRESEHTDPLLELLQEMSSSSSDENVGPEDDKKSSSSDSSSSSSSSSDGASTDLGLEVSDGDSDRKLPRERRVAMSEYTMAFGDHELHFNLTGQYLRAHCSLHGEGCRRQRTVNPSKFAFHNRGQGRPIGLLTSWLESASKFATRNEHVKASSASLASRKESRNRFKGFKGARQFLTFERAKAEGEESEPDDII